MNISLQIMANALKAKLRARRLFLLRSKRKIGGGRFGASGNSVGEGRVGEEASSTGESRAPGVTGASQDGRR
jgi:hypothetical protein